MVDPHFHNTEKHTYLRIHTHKIRSRKGQKTQDERNKAMQNGKENSDSGWKIKD